MMNKSVSEFVAQTMNNVLNSKEHKNLFGIKTASFDDGSSVEKSKDDMFAMDKECDKDSEYADKNSAVYDGDASIQSLEELVDEAKKCANALEINKPTKKFKEYAKILRELQKSCEDSVKSPEEDEEDEEFTIADANNYVDDSNSDDQAFAVAADGLLTASAALDSVGFVKSATLSLKLASLIIEAKAKAKAKKDDKKGKNPFAKKPGSSSSSSSSSKPKAKDKVKPGSSSSSSSSGSKKPVSKKK